MDVTPRQLAEIFRRNLAEIRTSKGISQVALSQKTGIAQPQISSLERGATIPTATSIARIADALGVQPWVLLFEAEPTAKTHGARIPSISR